MVTDTREDILVRPDNDVPLAPYSVYLDVSPQETDSFVSDTFRVWELLDDCHNLPTAEERWRMYQIDPEFTNPDGSRQAIKIRSNEGHWWITNHPVFHMTSNTNN